VNEIKAPTDMVWTVGRTQTNGEYNKDGSLDVYVQKDSPGKDKEANWLPAAAGDFSITMRVYWPKPAMLDGSWTPPPVKQAQ
jgi:hypothetical protein